MSDLSPSTDWLTQPSKGNMVALATGNGWDANITIALFNAETEERMIQWSMPNNIGHSLVIADDRWWDQRAVSLWNGENRNWTFYWHISASSTIDRGDRAARQPVFVVIQTALPNNALRASSLSQVEASISASRAASISAYMASMEDAPGYTPPRPPLEASLRNKVAIAISITAGIAMISTSAVVFVLLRYFRRKRSVRKLYLEGKGHPVTDTTNLPIPVGSLSPPATMENLQPFSVPKASTASEYTHELASHP
jgi:hypothetical protein